MDILEKINSINSLSLERRINEWKELIDLADHFLNSNNLDEIIGQKLLECIRGMRTSRFIDSDIDVKLLDVSIEIARNQIKYNPHILKELLTDAIYYSNYFPEKYNKIELEQEIQSIE